MVSSDACLQFDSAFADRARPRPQGREPPLLFEGADARRTGICPDHASLLAITGHEDVPMRRTAQLTFEGHCSRGVRLQMVRAAQVFSLDRCLVAQRGLLAEEFPGAVKVKRAIMQIGALAGENVTALKFFDRALLLRCPGRWGQQTTSGLRRLHSLSALQFCSISQHRPPFRYSRWECTKRSRHFGWRTMTPRSLRCKSPVTRGPGRIGSLDHMDSKSPH